MQYELVRSNRRTLAITIDGSGRCVVRAPMRMPMAEIKKFIEEKRSWIENKLCEIELKTELAPREPELKEGAEWVIAGNSVRIKFIAGAAKDYAQFAPDGFICSKKLGRPGLIKFLRGFARDLFYWRVDKYAQVIGVKPLGVKVSEAQTRWGSCSAQNVLNFSWRLIFAPPALIDYVVVHELCHIGCMNHSPAFWQRVAAVMPDYKQRRQALKQHGYLLKWFR